MTARAANLAAIRGEASPATYTHDGGETEIVAVVQRLRNEEFHGALADQNYRHATGLGGAKYIYTATCIAPGEADGLPAGYGAGDTLMQDGVTWNVKSSDADPYGGVVMRLAISAT